MRHPTPTATDETLPTTQQIRDRLRLLGWSARKTRSVMDAIGNPDCRLPVSMIHRVLDSADGAEVLHEKSLRRFKRFFELLGEGK